MHRVILAALGVAAVVPLAHANGYWLKRGWPLRIQLEVKAGQFARVEKPAEVHLNFTSLLTSGGQPGVFNDRSLRMVEVDEHGRQLDRHTVFQFDRDPDFDPASNAAGNLTFLMRGRTEAGSSRYFHLYFNRAGRDYSVFPFGRLVEVGDEVEHEGQSSYRITTRRATYLFHKQGAGFASLIDLDGNDWISYRPDNRSAGEFRGIPNLGSCFHPGYTNSSSQLLNQGPLKATIYSETNDREWAAIWEIYPTYARMTLQRSGGNYWFLYEGTPGGKLDLDRDYVVTPTGRQRPVSESWAGDFPKEEWVYFGDTSLNRVLYLVNHQDDDAPDYFRQMNAEMTVFGFGRHPKCCDKYMEAVPARFTIGLAETSSAPAVAERIHSAWQPLAVTVSPVEVR